MGNMESSNDLVLESSPVAPLLQQVVTNGRWQGTASGLLNSLNALADERTQKLMSWPKTPRTLSGVLRRLAPNLRVAGVNVRFEREEKKRTITLEKMGHSSSGASAASLQSQGHDATGIGHDANGLRNDTGQESVLRGNDANDGDDAKIPIYSKAKPWEVKL